MPVPGDQESDLELKDAVKIALDEARMILPGIQALFGFQLIAAFNDRFNEIFDKGGQELHLLALILVALSCALAMTPAAYHRRCERISRKLLLVAQRFVGLAMVPLLLAISIDVGLVTWAVTEHRGLSWALGAASAIVFSLLWLVYPRRAR